MVPLHSPTVERNLASWMLNLRHDSAVAGKLGTAQVKRKAKDAWYRRAVNPVHTMPVIQPVPATARKRRALRLFQWPTLPNTASPGEVVAPPCSAPSGAVEAGCEADSGSDRASDDRYDNFDMLLRWCSAYDVIISAVQSNIYDLSGGAHKSPRKGKTLVPLYPNRFQTKSLFLWHRLLDAILS